MNKILMSNKWVVFTVMSFAILLTACVSQKKKGEVSKAAKFYHNTTAHYNGYFNANELMVASIDKLKEQHQDNFNEVLAIYPEYAAGKPELVAEDLDKAIEKVSIVATVHEPSRWVDDCYIILGKAQFLKQDYETAEETFLYFIEEFDPSVTRRKTRKSKKTKKGTSKKKGKSVKEQRKEREKKKKKKKKSNKGKKKKSTKKKKETAAEKKARMEKEAIAKEAERKKERDLENSVEVDRTSSGLLKHLSAFPEGLMWVAKTYVTRQKYNLVDFYLNKITEQPEVHKDILSEVPIVRAFNTLEQEKYDETIVHLDEAIPLQKDKKRKARLIFIRSQLHQELGNTTQAFAGFNEVIDMKPDFLMEFNAALRMLKNSMGSGDESLATVERKLRSMLKEDKFRDFQDQIYYTLGEINFDRGDVSAAIPNFQKSIQVSKGNETQLTEAYYVLAKIFYDQEDYVLSKNYYDSTSTVINKKDDRFFEVEAYAKNLKEIADNIVLVQLQDSLIRLSKMTPEERADIARQLKKEELLAAAALKGGSDEEEAPVSGLRRIDPSRGAAAGARQSTWWAYDENKRQDQAADFKREWGFRSLEDDWRRSNKSTGIADIEDISSDDDLDISDDEISQIMKDVPLTADALAASKLKIQNALFDLGILFRERIENFNKAIEAHESLQERFPGSEKEVDALYYLYLSNLDIDDNSRAQYYLNLLKSKYPEAKYTLAITDPTYIESMMAEGKIQETMYNAAYKSFEGGDYSNVISLEKEAFDKFKDENVFGSKYALLSAMATGKMKGKDAYIRSLKSMIATYPNTDEEARAKEILRFLNGDEEAFASIDEGEAEQAFRANDSKLHYICVIVRSKKDSDLNAAKISISNYNRKYHKVDRIRISSTILNKDNNTDVILLRKFSNKEAAMKYYNEVERNKKEFMEPKVSYELFAVTQQNYREVMKKKSTKEYEVFFNKNYLEE